VTTGSAKEIKIVYCYARKDKVLLDELDRHLGTLKRLGQITTWHDREILPGGEWKHEINLQLLTADIPTNCATRLTSTKDEHRAKRSSREPERSERVYTSLEAFSPERGAATKRGKDDPRDPDCHQDARRVVRNSRCGQKHLRATALRVHAGGIVRHFTCRRRATLMPPSALAHTGQYLIRCSMTCVGASRFRP